jgi:small subunit ribosomal protein S18
MLDHGDDDLLTDDDGDRNYRRIRRSKRCRFDSADEIDYKDIATLQKLITAQGKIMGRKRSGNNATCQRATKIAVKRARFLALIPYVS